MSVKAMTKNGLLAALASLFALTTAQASTVHVTYKGFVETKTPTVLIESNSSYPEFYQGVIEYNLKSITDNGVCTFRANQSLAYGSFNSEDWNCLFEWDKNVAGLSVDGLFQRGYIRDSGIAELPYSIYVFSGKDNERHLITRGVTKIDVTAPEEPVIVDANVNWLDRNEIGLEQLNHNPDSKIVRVRFTVEPRPYRQRLSKGANTCLVNPEDTTCTVAVTPQRAFGERHFNLQGVTELFFQRDSHNYFWERKEKTPVVVEWDYRPPELHAVELNIGHEAEDIRIINVDNHAISIAKDEGVIVLKSPHTGRDGKWWHLKNSSVEINLDNDVEVKPYIVIDGTRIHFQIPYFTWDTKHQLKSQLTPEIIGDYLIYRYDFSKVPDGRYSLKAELKDAYDNGTTEVVEDLYIDRFAPDIKVLIGDRELRNGYPIFFTSDLSVGASGGWDDGTQIDSATYAGQELELSCESPNYCHIQTTAEGLVKGEVYDFVVKASDHVGNKSELVMKFPFAPVKYEMVGIPNVVVADVQNIRLRARQTEGFNCAYATTEAAAVVRASLFRHSCIINWSNLPSNLEDIGFPSQSIVEGTVKEVGEHKVKFNVYYFNSLGHKMLVDTVEQTIATLPPAKPTIEMSRKNRLAPGVYGLPFHSRLITQYNAAISPGDAIITAENTQANEVYERYHEQRRTRNTLYNVRGPINIEEEHRGQTMSRYVMPVKVQYVNEPSIVGEEVIDVINLPQTRVKTYLQLDHREALSTEMVPARIMVGRYDSRNDELDYSVEDYGVYDVHIIMRTREGDVQITETTKLPESGILEIEIPASDLFRETREVRAIAKLRSPHPEFNIDLTSASQRIYVLKGEAVDADLRSRRITGKAPLATVVVLGYLTNEDQKVSSEVTWEISDDDGATWVSRPEEFGRRTRFRTVVAEAGKRLVRAKVTNIRTGEVTTTEHLELIAFDQPSIRIVGSRQVYEGSEGTYQISDFGEIVGHGDGEIEWSLDEGQSWSETGPELVLTPPPGRTQLHARFRYAETPDSIKEPAWDYTRVYIESVGEEPVRLNPRVPTRVDVDVPFALTANTTNPQRHIGANLIVEWTTPSGEVLNGHDISYTLPRGEYENASDVYFHVGAWVEGYKEKTYAERLVKIQIIDYEFPDSRLRIRAPILVVPARVNAAVFFDYIYAPGARFYADFALDNPEFDVSYQRNMTADFTIMNEGLHRLDVKVYDNRGNERQMTEFIEVVKAPPMEGELRIKASNDYSRAPLRLSTSVSATPGHPGDRRAEVVWMLNGEVIEGYQSSFARFNIDEPGEHTVSVKVVSRYGQVGVFEETVVVKPNKVPVCEPTTKIASLYVEFNANCTDEDGRIIGYEWLLNGSPISAGGIFRVRNSNVDGPMFAEFVVTDDSGEKTEGSIFFPGL